MQVNVGSIKSNLDEFDCIADIARKTDALFVDSNELNLSSCRFSEANITAPLYTVKARLRDELNDVLIINIPPGVSTIRKKNKFLTVFKLLELDDTNQTILLFKIFK